MMRKLRSAELRGAAHLLARGMRDDPLHVKAFGPEAHLRVRALARFFEPVLRRALNRGGVYGVFLDEKLVGIYVEIPPGRCNPTLLEKLKFFPSVCFGNPPATTMRVLQWVAEWSRRDHGILDQSLWMRLSRDVESEAR